MTLTELYNVLLETHLPVAYRAFKPEENVKPPCITYKTAFSSNFGADNKVYSPFLNIDIKLFEEIKDGSELVLEDVLNNNSIFWDKTETWDDTEKVYEILYEVKINAC